ncbi:nitrogenase cofactor biosynthesis protein NifB [Clostridium tyrobutyricum]|uniref:nitrogenase cofactor biosynthesis protein NifB n=1 Tax=Clostridium tyrobutyricum TaxID=1519 RepID=UPI001C384ECB|nr:nitrogenase cofactor biosynthesis protein NifB [Clostridium tyrobutyricum]MBV4420388.1 nitrogenase cofactor biosynthesis protein NifB [Clostridium tyrobutyricum]
MSIDIASPIKSIEERTLSHPCYNCIAHKYARMHIPVAPKCNVSCNFCSRKYDCVNESRPGVTSQILTPEEARDKFNIVKEKVKNLTVVGIAGPGDPLANFEEVKKSVELIKEESPDITFCLSTNGLMLPFYADEIVKLGISHVTITINAVDPKIGGRVYKFINYLGKKFSGEEAGNIILNNQLSGLRYISQKGIISKVNIVMIKDINDTHVPEIVKKVKECGAYMTNIIPLIPIPGTVFENLPATDEKELNNMRKKCQLDLKQMFHCKQCRADAIGTLENDISKNFRSNKNNYRIAVSSKTGVNIDQHFGHASEFYIYDVINGQIKFKEKRSVSKYCNGIEDCEKQEDKILDIIKTIEDCNAVLVLRAGFEPANRLKKSGIRIFQMYDEINSGIEKAVKLLENN